MMKQRKAREDILEYTMDVGPADDEDRAWLKRVTEEDEAEFGKSDSTDDDYMTLEEVRRELGLN